MCRLKNSNRLYPIVRFLSPVWTLMTVGPSPCRCLFQCAPVAHRCSPSCPDARHTSMAASTGGFRSVHVVSARFLPFLMRRRTRRGTGIREAYFISVARERTSSTDPGSKPRVLRDYSRPTSISTSWSPVHRRLAIAATALTPRFFWLCLLG